MAEGYDPAEERERLETTVDEDLGGGEVRRYYVKTATQNDQLVAVVIEAAPGSYLTSQDISSLETHVKKLGVKAKSGNGRRRKAPTRKAPVRKAPSGNGRRRRKAT